MHIKMINNIVLHVNTNPVNFDHGMSLYVCIVDTHI